MITYDFTGKVAFITGAAIVDRDADAAERVASELTGKGLVAIGIGCDVSDEQHTRGARIVRFRSRPFRSRSADGHSLRCPRRIRVTSSISGRSISESRCRANSAVAKRSS